MIARARPVAGPDRSSFPIWMTHRRFAVACPMPVFFLLAAVLIRLPHFGDPALNQDEGFYLWMGDRLLHGALPYVDVWDRKPIGLFLIYAAIRLLGGDGIWQYQMVACAFAGTTAWIIYRVARMQATPFAAAVGGIAYLAWIETVGGEGGQSPVFYNALMAGAAWAVLAATDPRAAERRRANGMLAMALTGVAIQIKYTALFEGLFFGLLLGWNAIRYSAGWARAIAWTTTLAAIALAPSLLAMIFYAGRGYFHAFWFANFVSIGLRGAPDPAQTRLWLAQDLTQLLVLGLCLIASMAMLARSSDAAARRWAWIVGGWAVVALIGFSCVGMFFCHYLLPVFVPLAVGASPIFGRKPIGPVLALIALLLPLKGIGYPGFDATARSEARIATLRRMLPSDVERRCLAVLNAPAILYQLTRACTRTRFAFPDHLVSSIETKALGVNQPEELQRLLESRPAALVIGHGGLPFSPVSRHIIQRSLDQAYLLRGTVPTEEGSVQVWLLAGGR